MLAYYIIIPRKENGKSDYIEKRVGGKICPVEQKVVKMVVPLGTYLHGTWSSLLVEIGGQQGATHPMSIP
jgi:hypothetical protein